MIDLYDGNNIMRRAYEQRGQLPGQRPMNLRMRFEHAMAQPAGSQIWVWDGRGHNQRRRDIYPLYKMNRNPTPEDVFAQIRLWKDIAKHSPIVQIEVEGWEADDVIGTMARKYPGRFKVHTNDMDYGQINHLCLLNGVNLKGIPAKWIPLFKAFCGDSSDNIKGIPGFGPKRWEEMTEHWDVMRDAVAAGNQNALLDLPFKPAVKAWLADAENIELLQSMLIVTHFQNVPDDELEGGMFIGTPNRNEASAILQRFFM